MCYTLMYNDGIFEWDERKAKLNLKEHGVTFAVATRVFGDPNRIIEFDRLDDETDEERWHAIGLVGAYVLVLIVHVYGKGQDENEITRIISAREADPSESQRYFG